jgi:phosphorylcholine metabolism protein LicD
MYGCTHVQLGIGDVKLIAVLDTEAEISLMPESIFEDLLAKDFKTSQLPVMNGALITALEKKTGLH